MTFIRPYEEQIRLVVVATLRRAGAIPSRVFRPPIEHADIERYLAGPGRADQLVIPFFKSGEGSGVELASRYHAAAGVERRILMPTRYALPSAVAGTLREAIGPAAARVLVVSVGQLDDQVEQIRAHLRGRSC